MTITITHPADPASAVNLLSSLPPLLDCAAASAALHPDRLRRAFGTPDRPGPRTPDLVWVASDPYGQPLAAVAGLDLGDQAVLDVVGGVHPEAVREVVAAAARAVEGRTWSVACLYGPPGSGYHSPGLEPWRAGLEAAGWGLLTERNHYEHPPVGLDRAAPLAAASRLRLERLADPADPRLPGLVREVLDGTGDVADRAALTCFGVEKVVASVVDDLAGDDLRLVFDERGALVGYVAWSISGTGTGCLEAVGVDRRHRGHGYGRELAALATVALVEAGCHTLLADTDVTNTAMVRAFADLGWHVSEQRTDAVPVRLLP